LIDEVVKERMVADSRVFIGEERRPKGGESGVTQIAKIAQKHEPLFSFLSLRFASIAIHHFVGRTETESTRRTNPPKLQPWLPPA
jgi:hypothetical protein